jgi:acyl carrier protein phosphodiesterase
MNFLAHLHLARGDEGLVLGAMLGDFVRGRRVLQSLPPGISQGISLHRRIDRVTDHSRQVKALRRSFPREFRRYAGIVIDLGFDHVLARDWIRYSGQELEKFDLEVRETLRRNDPLLPGRLRRFMRYADRRGLFAAYRREDEMLFSLAGIGTRLKRANPLHRVGEIWPDIKTDIEQTFESVFPKIQSDVDHWRKRRSTTTGS